MEGEKKKMPRLEEGCTQMKHPAKLGSARKNVSNPHSYLILDISSQFCHAGGSPWNSPDSESKPTWMLCFTFCGAPIFISVVAEAGLEDSPGFRKFFSFDIIVAMMLPNYCLERTFENNTLLIKTNKT